MQEERSEVSVHEIRLFRVLTSSPDVWFTSNELTGLAKLGGSTCRQKLIKLVRLGIVEQAKMHPDHLYRCSDKASKKAAGYFNRLAAASEVLSERERQQVKV